MQVAYFVNSGSEANDMAIMMARLYSGNYDVLALRNGYHGLSESTMGATAHSTWKCNVPQVPPIQPLVSRHHPSSVTELQIPCLPCKAPMDSLEVSRKMMFGFGIQHDP